MDERQILVVSGWMENGNVNELIKSCEDVDRFELVRLSPASARLRSSLTTPQQLEDVARRLVYMHDQGMVHGDPEEVRV